MVHRASTQVRKGSFTRLDTSSPACSLETTDQCMGCWYTWSSGAGTEKEHPIPHPRHKWPNKIQVLGTWREQSRQTSCGRQRLSLVMMEVSYEVEAAPNSREWR